MCNEWLNGLTGAALPAVEDRGGRQNPSHVSKARAVRVGQPIAGFMHEGNNRKAFTLEGFGVMEFTPINDGSDAALAWWGAK